MFEVAKKIDDKSFFIRLNTLCNAADAVANDVQYHMHNVMPKNKQHSL